MPEHAQPAPYHTLIHIGCGATPNLDEYRALAQHVWLIDADSGALATLEAETEGLDQIHTRHALVDTEERPGTFYRYSLPWASGLAPADDATQRLYPGLRCLSSTEQPTMPIGELIAQCLPAESDASHLLLLDIGRHNAELLSALEESGLLSRLTNVFVVPAHRRDQQVSVPPSLYGPVEPPKGLTLPENSQVLERHPLLRQLQRQQQEAKQHRQAREHSQQQLAERDKQLSELNHQRDEKAKQAESAVKERDALKQQLEQAQQHLAEREKQLDERTQQRDEKAKQADNAIKARNELKQQLEQFKKSKEAQEKKIKEMQNALDKEKKLSYENSEKAEQYKVEYEGRLNSEISKAEAQLSVLKEVVLRNKVS